MTTHPRATAEDYRTALQGLVFPASKAAVVERARDYGGIDAEVTEVVTRLPDRDYPDAHDLELALRAIYLLEGVPPEAVPV